MCCNKQKQAWHETPKDRVKSQQHSDTEQASAQLKDEELVSKMGGSSVIWVEQIRN